MVITYVRVRIPFKGDPLCRSGLAVHVFSCNTSMENSAFQSADGEMLIVAQEGNLNIKTEFGLLKVVPGEICIIPQGIRFAVNVEGNGLIILVLPFSFGIF